MYKNITVIGSGLMGSAIAAHFANAGCNVNLLDIVDKKNKNKNYRSFEENILNLEKNATHNLMRENLTIERLEHILETGKYLRN